jgi:hypothetical protein
MRQIVRLTWIAHSLVACTGPAAAPFSRSRQPASSWEAVGITVAHRTRDVPHGVAELRRIQDDATFLHSRGVPDSELIFSTSPDHRDNRALIVISATSASLLQYLAPHYPADALAVEVNPAGPGGGPATTP